MYYTDRLALGNILADKVSAVVPRGTVIVCLKSTAKPVCAALARRLDSWIFDLTYEPVCYPGDPTRFLGAVTADGGFCVHPAMSELEYRAICYEFHGWLSDAKRSAMRRLHQRQGSAETQVDRRLLNLNHVMLVADVLTDTLALAAARTILQPLQLRALYAAAGNVTADIYDALRLQTDACEILHILPGHVFADDHYFSGPRFVKQQRPKQVILPFTPAMV